MKPSLQGGGFFTCACHPRERGDPWRRIRGSTRFAPPWAPAFAGVRDHPRIGAWMVPHFFFRVRPVYNNLMSQPRTLFEKIWDRHVVHREKDGTSVLYIDLHLTHEVTTPQAFEGLRAAGRVVRRPDRTIAVAD